MEATAQYNPDDLTPTDESSGQGSAPLTHEMTLPMQGAPNGIQPMPNPQAASPGTPIADDPNAPPIPQAPGFIPGAGQIAGLAPAQIQSFGGTPQVTPTYGQATMAGAPGMPNPYLASAAQMNPIYMTAAGVDPNSAQSYLDQSSGMLRQSLADPFRRQQQQLDTDNAARGLTNSGAGAQLETNLLADQAGVLAGAMQPMVSQAFGYNQQDLMSNSGYEQQARQLNQGAGMTAAQTNTGNSQAVAMANPQMINAFLSQGYSYDQAVTMANQQASNQFGAANMQSANQATSANAGFYNADRNANAAAYNDWMQSLFSAGSGLFGNELSAYLNSYGPNSGVTGMMNTGMSGAQSTYNNVYGATTQAQGAALGALAQGAGMAFGVPPTGAIGGGYKPGNNTLSGWPNNYGG